MPPRLDDLLAHIAQLEREVEGELAHAREKWRYRLDAGRIRFERDVRQAHARLKQSVPRFIRESEPRNLITAPVIYSLIVPIALLDLWISLYQAVCFPLYGIELVRRSRFIAVDRHHLGYLNVIEKLNCDFCGYANGVFAFVREVAARTEQYWCPIRHARHIRSPHLLYRNFVDYGDAAGYQRRLPILREDLRDGKPQPKRDA
jgi:hypothetical protein